MEDFRTHNRQQTVLLILINNFKLLHICLFTKGSNKFPRLIGNSKLINNYPINIIFNGCGIDQNLAEIGRKYGQSSLSRSPIGKCKFQDKNPSLMSLIMKLIWQGPLFSFIHTATTKSYSKLTIPPPSLEPTYISPRPATAGPPIALPFQCFYLSFLPFFAVLVCLLSRHT